MAESNSDQKLINKMADWVRRKSAQGNLTQPMDFKGKGFEISENEIKNKLETFKEAEEFTDIRILSGEQEKYIFSDENMTKKYAKLMAKVEEDDIKGMIANTVRKDSRVYPRPTDSKIFFKSPFNLEEDVFQNVFEQMKEKKEYSDIKEIEASNGALYLYSNKHLDKDHAIGLTEWVEVIRKEIP